MAKGELAPIRIPVVIDTAGLDAQLKNAQGKISGSGLGRGQTIGGVGGGGGFVGNGIGGGGGMGSAFAAAAASGGIAGGMQASYLGSVIERQFATMSRQQMVGMKIKKTKRSGGGAGYPYLVRPVSYWGGTNWGKTMGAGLSSMGASEETSEYTFFGMSSEQASAYSEKIHGGPAGGGFSPNNRPSRAGRNRQLTGAGGSAAGASAYTAGGWMNIPPPPDGLNRFAVMGSQLAATSPALGRLVGGLGGMSLGAMGLGIPLGIAGRKLGEMGTYFANYSKNMSSNTQSMAAGYLGGSLQENALAFQRNWQTATPQPGGYWQRLMAQWRGTGVDVAMDYLATGWDVMTAPETLSPNAWQYGSQRLQEFKIRNFGTDAEKKELFRKQKRAARAAERNSI